MARLVAGQDAGRPLARAHLLLLPEDLPTDVVVGLVRTRHPEVAPAREGGWRLGRWTTLTGPLALDDAAAAAAGVPPGWPAVWSLACPVEREGPPLAGTTDREGLHRAFADGLPVRAERRAVDLALALARRLGGAVRAAPSGVLLHPDPRAWVDRVVHSPSWLDPDQAHQVASAAVPGVELAVDGQAWQGLRPEAVAALEAPGAGTGLDEHEREQLHLAADAADVAAVAQDDVLDAYALVAGARSGLEGGVVEVRVSGATEVPGALAGLPWAGAAVAYAVTWWPDDVAAAEREDLPPEHRATRDAAATVVDALAGALVDAVGGVVLDADGFPLEPGA